MRTRNAKDGFPAANALGMLITISTGLGCIHLGHEVAVAGPRPASVGMLLGSVAAVSLGVAMWAGLLSRPPRRSRPSDR